MTFGIRHHYGYGRVKTPSEQAKSDAWFYGMHLIPQSFLVVIMIFANFECWSEAHGGEVLLASALTLVSVLLVGTWGMFLTAFIAAIRSLKSKPSGDV